MGQNRGLYRSDLGLRCRENQPNNEWERTVVCEYKCSIQNKERLVKSENEELECIGNKTIK